MMNRITRKRHGYGKQNTLRDNKFHFQYVMKQQNCVYVKFFASPFFLIETDYLLLK